MNKFAKNAQSKILSNIIELLGKKCLAARSHSRLKNKKYILNLTECDDYFTP